MSVYFKHASLEQLKPISISFGLFTKNYILFPPNLNVKRFWKCNIFEYAINWAVGVNQLKRHTQTGGTRCPIRNSLFPFRKLCENSEKVFSKNQLLNIKAFEINNKVLEKQPIFEIETLYKTSRWNSKQGQGQIQIRPSMAITVRAVSPTTTVKDTYHSEGKNK